MIKISSPVRLVMFIYHNNAGYRENKPVSNFFELLSDEKFEVTGVWRVLA